MKQKYIDLKKALQELDANGLVTLMAENALLLDLIRDLEDAERVAKINGGNCQKLEDSYNLYHKAHTTWQNKTQWMQNDKRFSTSLSWGKHRADVLKEYIEYLEGQRAITIIYPYNLPI